MSLHTLPPSFYSPGRTAYAPSTDTKAKQRQEQRQGFMKKALIGTAMTAAVLGGGGFALAKTRPDLLEKGLGLLRQHAPEGLKNLTQSAQQKLGQIVEHGVPAFQKAWTANATAPNIAYRLKQSFQAFPGILKELATPKHSRKMFGFFGY